MRRARGGANGANNGPFTTRKYWLVGVILLIVKVPQFSLNARQGRPKGLGQHLPNNSAGLGIV